MKNMKLTAAVLALIAAAVFNPAAKAASVGDIFLGVYDANTSSSTVTNSFELDLGSFSSLSYGETFSLGTSVTDLFSSDSSASLVFNIAGSGATGGGGLGAKEVVLTAGTLPKLPTFGGNTTPSGNIASIESSFSSATALTLPSGTSSTGVAISAAQLANSTSGSFEQEISNNAGSYGFGGGNPSVILSSYANGSTVNFYDIPNKSGQESATALGTFEILGTGANTELVYAAAPEPSTYALMACGLVALGAVTLRRRANA